MANKKEAPALPYPKKGDYVAYNIGKLNAGIGVGKIRNKSLGLKTDGKVGVGILTASNRIIYRDIEDVAVVETVN